MRIYQGRSLHAGGPRFDATLTLSRDESGWIAELFASDPDRLTSQMSYILESGQTPTRALDIMAEEMQTQSRCAYAHAESAALVLLIEEARRLVREGAWP